MSVDMHRFQMHRFQMYTWRVHDAIPNYSQGCVVDWLRSSLWRTCYGQAMAVLNTVPDIMEGNVYTSFMDSLGLGEWQP